MLVKEATAYEQVITFMKNCGMYWFDKAQTSTKIMHEWLNNTENHGMVITNKI